MQVESLIHGLFPYSNVSKIDEKTLSTESCRLELFEIAVDDDITKLVCFYFSGKIQKLLFAQVNSLLKKNNPRYILFVDHYYRGDFLRTIKKSEIRNFSKKIEDIFFRKVINLVSEDEGGRNLSLVDRCIVTGNKLGTYQKIKKLIGDRGSLISEYDVSLFERNTSSPSPKEIAINISHIYIRSRGAVIVICSKGDSKEVLRIAIDGKRLLILQKNHEALLTLAKNIRSKKFEGLVPTSRVVCNQESGKTVFSETLIDGVLAWKIRGDKQAYNNMIESSLDALSKIQSNFNEEVKFNISNLSTLVFGNYNQLACNTDSKRLVANVNGLCSWLCSRWADRNAVLTYGHGDFGTGNIQVDSDTGNLRGIIDWDTSISGEIFGIDQLNLFFQEFRATNRAKSIEGEVIGGFSYICYFFQEYGVLEGLPIGTINSDLKALFVLMIIRFITRAARYPAELKASEERFVCWTNYLNEIFLFLEEN